MPGATPGFLSSGRQTPSLSRDTKRLCYLLDMLGADHSHVHERRPGMGDHRPQMLLYAVGNAECGHRFAKCVRGAVCPKTAIPPRLHVHQCAFTWC